MKGFGEVVIGTGGEAANDVLLFGHAGQDDDVSIRTLKALANLPAQLNAGKIRHQPVGDNERGKMSLKKFEGLFASLGHQHGFFSGSERIQKELAMHWGIVNNKY